jgi:hypothetical protein
MTYNTHKKFVLRTRVTFLTHRCFQTSLRENDKTGFSMRFFKIKYTASTNLRGKVHTFKISSAYPCTENQIDALLILSLFRQSTSTCFGHIWPTQPTVSQIKKHNIYQLLYIYIQYNSWWWATNMPKTWRGWFAKQTEDKQCIKLVFIIWMYRDAQSTKHKFLSPSSEVVKTWHEFPTYMVGKIVIFFNKPRTDMKYTIQPQSVIILLIMRSRKGTSVTCTHVWEQF